MKDITVGYAMTGSFCTLAQSIKQLENLRQLGYRIQPIMSESVISTDTRFGRAEDIKRQVKGICSLDIIESISQAEPIGPKKLLDVLIVSPCTGNTLGKLASGIYDTPVTMAAKAHLRNCRPILIGVSTNDALAASAKSIGTLMNFKNYYFIPMKQDNPEKKPFSVVTDFTKTAQALEAVLRGEQLQPILL